MMSHPHYCAFFFFCFIFFLKNLSFQSFHIHCLLSNEINMKVSNTATFRSNASINNFVQTSGSISATLGLPLMLMSLLVEILLLILSKVSRHDLTSCARISASFNGLTTPLVWRMIRIDSLAQLDCPKSIEAQCALIRNAHCVRDLFLNDFDMFRMFNPHLQAAPSRASSISALASLPTTVGDHPPVHCNHLETLHVQLESLPADHKASSNISLERRFLYMSDGLWTVLSPYLQQDVIVIVQQNPGLAILRVNNILPLEAMLKLTTATPHLRELSCAAKISPRTAKYVLESLPESIQRVHLGYVSKDENKPRKRRRSLCPI